MCGITGFFSPSLAGQQKHETLKRMLAQIRHRGPDESGTIHANAMGMGNVRLNIIDLAGGTQPISDASGKYWIVFNGEIFNYLELRKELEARGCTFRTNSDTEVLVQLYATYGKQGLNKLNGQFAFAIWNKETNALFLARDRVGIRPLYYTHQNGHFVFGSEIKAIFQFPFVQPELNPLALNHLFTFWAPLSPHTFFKDILEVPPGHCLELNNGKIKLERYWELTFNQTQTQSFDETREAFHALLKDAVALRLRSDVPVAAYLSGGLDSTATTRLIKDLQPQNLQTFSIGFEDRDYDETDYQQEASAYLNTTHKRFTCTNKEIGEAFADIIWHTEVPIIRTAPAPMYLLSKLVRANNIKVVITGEGADEMLGGYNLFKETIIRHFWAKDPDSKLRPLLLKKLYPYISYIREANPGMLRMFFGYALQQTDSPFYSHLIRWHNTSRLNNYLSADVNEHLQNYDPQKEIIAKLPDDFASYSPLAKAQWLEIHLFMSGYLLSSQGDRMAMANSVEGRYPFLDHRLMEFCAALPPNYKLKGLNEKYLLKKTMEGLIPQRITQRSKQAYRAPAQHMLSGKTASERIRNMLSDNMIKDYGMFDTPKVAQLVTKFEKGNNPSEIDAMALNGIASAQLLFQQFIANGQSHEPPITKLNLKKEIDFTQH